MKILLKTSRSSLRLISILAAVLFGIGSIQAATYTVNSTADPGNGVCDAVECTLREALTVAGTSAGADTIDFSITGTINLVGALPAISESVAINGPGSDAVIVRRDSGGDYRIFTVLNSDAKFYGIAISNGNTTAAGGGIYFFSETAAYKLSVSYCNVSGNVSNGTTGEIGVVAADVGGGGIAVAGGSIEISDSTISGNVASGAGGGGIGVIGHLLISRSTVSGNSATDPIKGNGGGVYHSGTGQIDTSTISGNSALGSASGFIISGGGGGVYGHLTELGIAESTITENSAPFSGGGVKSSDNLSIARGIFIQSSIVVGNTSTDLAGSVKSFNYNAVGAIESGSSFAP